MLLAKIISQSSTKLQSRQFLKITSNLSPSASPSNEDSNLLRHFKTSPSHENILKNLQILKNLRHLPSAPAPALCLGLAGLIPFVSAPLYIHNSGFFLPDVAFAQLAYGASILSFLGGVRWGLLVGDDKTDWPGYSWSVSPSLLAWVSLLVPDLTAGFLLNISGLLAAGVLDLQHSSYPAWLKGLRVILTLFAVLSLISSTVFLHTLASKKQPSDFLN